MSEHQPAPEPLRHQQVSETTRTLLDTEGESGRFEFKRDARAVNPKVLVAAANWAALSNRDKVTLLVGVDEDKDPVTGLVKGKIEGVPDLERAIETIQNYCKEIHPVPVRCDLRRRGCSDDEAVPATGDTANIPTALRRRGATGYSQQRIDAPTH
jgi:hypothetical protein